jgi:hypothetical protein
VGIIVVIVLVAAFVAGLSVLTRGGKTRDTAMDSPLAGTPTQGTAPPQQPVAADQLAGLLLDAKTLSSVMQAPGMASATPVSSTAYRVNVATPPNCTTVVDAGDSGTYAGMTGTTTAGGDLSDPNNPATTVTQFVTRYDSADDAAPVQDKAINAWRDCANTAVTLTAGGQPPRQITVGEPTSVQGRLTVTYSETGRACQHVLATESNVVIDVAACTPSGGQQADDIVKQITDKIE